MYSIKDRFNELRAFSLTTECKLFVIANNKLEKDRYISDLIKQFELIIINYKDLKEDQKNISDISYNILLNTAVEGLVKIIVFDKEHIDFLSIPAGNRSLGKLKPQLLNLILEKNERKREILSQLLDLIINQRNIFVHFPLYSEPDYRFEHYYFQIIAYLINFAGYWNLLNDTTGMYIKIRAQDKQSGFDLLDGVVLYE